MIKIEGSEALDKKLKDLSTSSPGFEKRLRGAIREILGQVRATLRNSAKEGLGMNSDPRQAYKAVRFAVYKRIFGGQVNILPGRGTKKAHYDPPRHPSRRGGNRRVRSPRTQDLLDYYGESRGFVLRFLNAGTGARYNGGRNGRTEYEREIFALNHEGRSYRGSIRRRDWFGPRSQKELEKAAAKLQKLIDEIINNEFI